LGLVYEKLDANQEAEENLSQAIKLLKEEGDLSPVSEYLIGLSDIYEKRGKDSAAINYALQSLKLAKNMGLKDQIGNANLKLSEIHEKTGNIPAAFQFYKSYVVYNDSVRNVTTAQELASQRADFEVLKKQGEVDLINVKRKNQQLVMVSSAVAMTLVGIIAFGLYRRNRFIKRSSILLEREKNRSDHLLRNILPEETAKELKENGHVKAQKFESATVLFADFKDFTQVAEKLTPEELITTLDYYFSNFDKIMEKYDIEKIKTLGDSYMAGSGIPFPTTDHAHRMILAALDIVAFVAETRQNDQQNGNFEIRIGIHSGPIIAGVVGTKKFAYDIWGDTVNIASRMESNSLPGKINISENTYELVKDRFECKYRGRFEAKNRGILKMYFVKACKT
ncbi:MAG: adenylate/guanylate cyclase domain-containing protein, partial [Gillisia sp.]